MTVGDWLVAVNDAFRGTDEDAPDIGSADADLWIRTLNRKKNELYNNTKVLFDETWSDESVGVVAAEVAPSFDLDTDFITLSDYVYVLDTSGNKHYYDIVKPRQRPTSGRQFYVAGMNPKVLYCSNEIESTENIIGGELYVPGYYMPADMSLTDENDVVRLPDPYWGVLAVAAEVAGNDITYEDKEANLNAKANALYSQMVRNNRRGTYGKGKVSPTNMYRIRSTEIN